MQNKAADMLYKQDLVSLHGGGNTQRFHVKKSLTFRPLCVSSFSKAKVIIIIINVIIIIIIIQTATFYINQGHIHAGLVGHAPVLRQFVYKS